MLFVSFVLYIVLPLLSATTAIPIAQSKEYNAANQQQITHNKQILIQNMNEARATQVNTPSPMPTITPTHTQKPQKPKDHLLTAINTYRKENGLSPLSSHPVLCAIAENRINELITLNQLDGHHGFDAQSNILKQHFKSWGEVLHFASPAWDAENIVRSGWATSSTGHREAMLNPLYTHGCGTYKSKFAVFIFGQQK